MERATSGGRRTYHHGDLRNALTGAAVELARTGGPRAVVLREVARTIGVSSTAAYRHFANHQDLVLAVKERGLAMLAAGMRARLEESPPCADPEAEAFRRLRASGLGYVAFALAEPGLFRTIFHDGIMRTDHRVEGDRVEEDGSVEPGAGDDEAYALMVAALDDLVECGRLPAERRAHTDIVLWAAVHGMATLLLDTDLSSLPGPAKDAVIARGLDIVLTGL